MNTVEMIRARHSVRSYQDRKLDAEVLEHIRAEIDRVNAESGLHIQFMDEAGEVFSTFFSRFIGWKYVPSYLALVGPDLPELEEKCGWYGEHLVLFLQSLGLNTCWVGAFKKNAVKAWIAPGERLVLTVAVGYGAEQGTPHKSKSPAQVTDVPEAEMPDWFRAGVECALLAPTAINQQKFRIALTDGRPVITVSANGPFVKADLGIVKYHFAAGSGVTPD